MSVKTSIEHDGIHYAANVATISSTSLGYEDHGILTANLELKWDSSGVAVGGYVLDQPDKSADAPPYARMGTAYGLDHLIRILETVGVDKWEALKGKNVYVLFEDGGGWGATPVGIANLLSGKAFLMKEHALAWKEREA